MIDSPSGICDRREVGREPISGAWDASKSVGRERMSGRERADERDASESVGRERMSGARANQWGARKHKLNEPHTSHTQKFEVSG